MPIHRVAAQEKGIALTLELPPHPVQTRINPDKLARVLTNLLTNALKFTPAGGRVLVRLELRAGGVRLTVQDTGIGIPAAAQAHIFDKFGSRLGVQDFALGTEGDSSGTKVAISGRLTSKLFISFGIGLFDQSQAVKLRYKLSPKLSLEALSSMESAITLFYTFRR